MRKFTLAVFALALFAVAGCNADRVTGSNPAGNGSESAATAGGA